MKYMLILPRERHNTLTEKLMEEIIEKHYDCACESVHDYISHSLFEDFFECEGILFLPYPDGTVDGATRWLIGLIIHLQKKVWRLEEGEKTIYAHPVQYTT